MTDLYGHKWTSVHGERDESNNWGKALYGITKHQMVGAMRVLMVSGDPWPPSAPEFRALCEAGVSNLGIPTADAAWREAVEASTDPTIWKFSHPIVQEAGRKTDWYAIRHGIPKAVSVQNRFDKHYADLTAKVQRGEQLIDDQHLIGMDKAKDTLAASDHAAERLLQERMRRQGVEKTTPQEALQRLRDKFGKGGEE